MSTGLAKKSLTDLLSVLKLEVCGSSRGACDQSRRRVSQKAHQPHPYDNPKYRKFNLPSNTFNKYSSLRSFWA